MQSWLTICVKLQAKLASITTDDDARAMETQNKPAQSRRNDAAAGQKQRAIRLEAGWGNKASGNKKRSALYINSESQSRRVGELES